MVIVALLLAALVFLALGLLTTGTVWLVLSLAASVLAGAFLYRSRGVLRAAGAAKRGEQPPRRRGRGRHTEAVVAAPDQPAEVWVIDGRPRYHRSGCEILAGQQSEPMPRARAVRDGFIACSLCEPDTVARDHPPPPPTP